jgi:hypothetical protein
MPPENHIDLTDKCIEYLYGLHLGDGNMWRYNVSARFKLTNNSKEYLEYHAKRFNSFGLKLRQPVIQPLFQKNGAEYFRIETVSYREFVILYNRFYYSKEERDKYIKKCNHKVTKCVCRGILLTPEICCNWYEGDGCLSHPGSRDTVEFATTGFAFEDVEFLMMQLNKLGFETSRTVQNKIYMHVNSTKKFLEWIYPYHNVSYYDYKYDYKDNRVQYFKRPVLQFGMNSDFIKQFESVTKAGKTVNIPRSSIYGCCQNRLKHAGGFVWRYDGDGV